MPSFLDSYLASLYLVWMLDWMLVFFLYGKDSLVQFRAQNHKLSEFLVDFVKMNLWIILSPFWSKASKWEINALRLPADYLEFGILLVSFTTAALGFRAVFVGFDYHSDVMLLVNIAFVTLSSIGAMIHLLIALQRKLTFWRLLYIFNFLTPLVFAGTMSVIPLASL